MRPRVDKLRARSPVSSRDRLTGSIPMASLSRSCVNPRAVRASATRRPTSRSSYWSRLLGMGDLRLKVAALGIGHHEQQGQVDDLTMLCEPEIVAEPNVQGGG